MNDPTPGLLALERHLAAGDVAAIRSLLFALTQEERQLLRAEIGDEIYQKIYSAARRSRRGAKRGHVVLLHGIMGANLDVIKASDRDRVWTNYWRLFNGRIADFELTLDGAPADPATQVLVAGQNKKYYLPMLLELATRWHVVPYAYDWRQDIHKSAEGLAATIREFAGDKPVHLVAHSMGGLVSRCFTRDFPELWKSMEDGTDLGRGGRLIMLGTPNHGSFSIAMAMSGGEKKVRQLAFLDRKHSQKELLRFLNTFPGSYQMLPSQHVDLGDQHARLFKKAAWGTKPVHQPLLDKARRFHDTLRPVVDADRFVYVAGHDRKTPHRLKIDKGKFSYQYTRDGDGRVPHVLGQLDGVTSFYVDEVHGRLASSTRVMADIHELLEKGRAPGLDSRVPSRRALDSKEWVVEPEEDTEAFEALLSGESTRRSPRRSQLSAEQQRRIESRLLEDGPDEEPDEEEVDMDEPRGELHPLQIQVVWGDITTARGHVFSVGHYRDVLPQKAERALDYAISGTDDLDRHILRQHSLRGNLRGDLGDVDFFPWAGSGTQRTVAVVGMGHPGTFGNDSLRVLIRKLVWAVSNLRSASEISTVLIGSGEGSLSIREAVRGLLRGIVDALGSEDLGSDISKVRIVELYRDRAEEILQELRDGVEQLGLREWLRVRIPRSVRKGRGGRVSKSDAMDMLLSTMKHDASKKANTSGKQAFRKLRDLTARRNPVAAEAFRETLDSAMKVEPEDAQGEGGRPEPREPVRMSFTRDATGIRVSAISNAATVSERVLRFDPKLIDDVVDQINETEERDALRFSEFITRMMLPREFREWLAGDGPFVFEVDRDMAQLHWETLIHDLDVMSSTKPLGARCQVARQMRTQYAPSPSRPRPLGTRLRALVVGDPGDPDDGHDLEGARVEALSVAKILRSHDVDVNLMIGAPNVPRRGRLRKTQPATRIGVLNALMGGGYDILHYSGHGDFDEKHPDRVGWVFSRGLLTARELEGMEQAPSLILANACLSGRISRASATSKRADRSVRESALLPSLADEFFRRGVRNYIGTAWTVSDEGAVLFSETFYEKLLKDQETVGEAVFHGRQALHEQQDLYEDLWAAYQHYGNPNGRMGS